MNKVQGSQAVFVLAGLTKPKTLLGITGIWRWPSTFPVEQEFLFQAQLQHKTM